MRTKLFTIISILFISISVNAQSDLLIKTVRLPKDSIKTEILTSNLNQFLLAAEKPNEENKWVLPSQAIETYILLDEIHSAQKSGRYKDAEFYKPYLGNILPLDNGQYQIQVFYMGVADSTPILRLGIEIIAHENGDSYLFSSPLKRNTKHWKTKSSGNFNFFYKETIMEKNVSIFRENAELFDAKLKTPTKPTDIYCCENRRELLKIIGVDYKIEYNGKKGGVFTSRTDKKSLMVSGNGAHFDDVNVHDLWHDRLGLAVNRRKKTNRPIDEGIAYVYGGSWDYTWDEIATMFKEKIASDKTSDWAYYKEHPFNFNDTKAKHLMVDYVINALIVKKLEKEKGFSAVWEFLNCGPREKGNANYYKALEKLTGITKENYNEKVWELVNVM